MKWPLWSTVPCKEGTPADRKKQGLDIGLPSPLDNLEIGNAFSGRFWRTPTRSYGELPGSEEGFIPVLEIFFLSICLPWCKYFGIAKLFCFIGWWRGCPGEARRMAAWFTLTIAFSTTLITQVWRRIIHLPGGPETNGKPLVSCFFLFFFKKNLYVTTTTFS